MESPLSIRQRVESGPCVGPAAAPRRARGALARPRRRRHPGRGTGGRTLIPRGRGSKAHPRQSQGWLAQEHCAHNAAALARTPSACGATATAITIGAHGHHCAVARIRAPLRVWAAAEITPAQLDVITTQVAVAVVVVARERVACQVTLAVAPQLRRTAGRARVQVHAIAVRAVKIALLCVAHPVTLTVPEPGDGAPLAAIAVTRVIAACLHVALVIAMPVPSHAGGAPSWTPIQATAVAAVKSTGLVVAGLVALPVRNDAPVAPEFTGELAVHPVPVAVLNKALPFACGVVEHVPVAAPVAAEEGLCGGRGAVVKVVLALIDITLRLADAVSEHVARARGAALGRASGAARPRVFCEGKAVASVKVALAHVAGLVTVRVTDVVGLQPGAQRSPVIGMEFMKMQSPPSDPHSGTLHSSSHHPSPRSCAKHAAEHSWPEDTRAAAVPTAASTIAHAAHGWHPG
eukprot:CAMPEP_0185163620 /NCGR_PEP_ID=MMETSP1139-20130426/8244_1 /TAXON_ID=298111 /ORGANISM="Pavlova sp., Strain CCMP459" /LENGTH=461 /DNA_ID=CAMNT_0027728977 /DNA_START=417 /DNA_END=1801 /DNA_ORIENTATION=-